MFHDDDLPSTDDQFQPAGTDQAIGGHVTMTQAPLGILRGLVPPAVCRDLLRTLWLDYVKNPPSPEALDYWRQTACPIVHPRASPLLDAVWQQLEAVWQQLEATFGMVDNDCCGPQFIWHLPQSDHWTAPPPHIDQEPPWADGQRYALIAGVALNRWDESNGTLRWWPDGSEAARVIKMEPGDVVVMQPGTRHAAGVNHGTTVRAGVFLRWLEPAGSGPTGG